MEKRIYMQPRIKTLPMPQLLQSFEVSGGGDAGGAASKGNNMMDDMDVEEKNVWGVDW
ncbi:MAG: hypothetical protein IJK42_01200 [Prevotella sp.]|mgnify:CR=1 FL=1|nr:hypothetical protein [Prevotella sp.]MBQ6208377.1 hypothetical protein [Prevotella sp.]